MVSGSDDVGKWFGIRLPALRLELGGAKMSDREFLHGPALSDRIRKVCAEDVVDCAVAFWGKDMRDDIFPRWGKQTVRIVCDISMGCNSKSTLQAYGAPENKRLRVRDGLHGKIYISNVGAVVTSANASLGGIGLSGTTARNIEAGIFLAPDTPAWRDAKALFAELWKSPQIDEGQLARAPVYAFDPRPRISSDGHKDPSLLERLKSYPDQFEAVLFIAEHIRLKKEEIKEAKVFYKREEKAGNFEISKRSIILQAKRSYFPSIFSNVIMFWFNEKGTMFELNCYVDVVPVRTGKYITLWGKKNWRRFWSDFDAGSPTRHLTPSEQKVVTKLYDGSWALPASQLAHILSEGA